MVVLPLPAVWEGALVAIGGDLETGLIIVFLALSVLALMLFLELKNTQREVREMRGELERKVQLGLSQVTEPVAQIPAIALRVEEIEREVAESRRIREQDNNEGDHPKV